VSPVRLRRPAESFCRSCVLATTAVLAKPKFFLIEYHIFKEVEHDLSRRSPTSHRNGLRNFPRRIL
jgi:hypothetical protein